jgi:hypothetical protein
MLLGWRIPLRRKSPVSNQDNPVDGNAGEIFANRAGPPAYLRLNRRDVRNFAGLKNQAARPSLLVGGKPNPAKRCSALKSLKSNAGVHG